MKSTNPIREHKIFLRPAPVAVLRPGARRLVSKRPGRALRPLVAASLSVFLVLQATTVPAEESGAQTAVPNAYNSVMDALYEALAADDAGIRQVTLATTRGFLTALKDDGGEEAKATLRAALRDAPAPALRAQAAYFLGVLEDTTAAGDLRGALGSGEPEVRFSAAHALRAIGEPVEMAFVNPYENILWDTAGYHDANLHTHTNFSDGRYDPHYAIDRYHDLNYEILALTDHDSLHFEIRPKALYPWTELNRIFHEIKDMESRRFGGTYGDVAGEEWQNRDPDTLGMVSIEGSEISRTHHIGSYFNDYAGGTRSEETAFQEIAGRGGLAMFFHPGRYNRPTEWYVDYYRRHDHVVGMEVYNQVDRYPVDRTKWDSVLYHLMPGRPVWGFANDDTHTDGHFGRNRNVFVLPELSKDAVFDAMKEGHLYFFVPVDQGTPPPIRITNAQVEGNGIRLEVEGDFDRIEWITFNPFTGESQILAEGLDFPIDALTLPSPFVRAVIICEKGRTYTQPFGVRIKDEEDL